MGGSRGGWLRETVFVARRDLSYLLRQRETLLWTFVMPIFFFYFIGTVTGGMGDPGGSEEEPDPLALQLPSDAGFLSDELARRLADQNYRVVRFGRDGAPLETPSTGSAGSTEDGSRRIDAYRRRLVIPDPDSAGAAGTGTFTERVLAGDRQRLTLVRRGEGLSLDFDRIRVGRAVYGVVADLAVLQAEGEEPGPEGFRALREAPRSVSLTVQPAGRRVEPPSGFSQAVPGTMVMFTMLVLLTSGSITLLIEREKGLLRRLASTPISTSSVVAGKWSARLAVGLIQIAFAMVAGSLLFGVGWGGALGMVCVVLFAWAAFNGSAAILLANLAGTEAQASGIGVLATMILAALGGAWWPIEVAPGWMQDLALLLPTGWAMDAMHRLVNFGYGPEAAWGHAAGLLAAAAVAGWAAVRTFRYD